MIMRLLRIVMIATDKKGNSEHEIVQIHLGTIW